MSSYIHFAGLLPLKLAAVASVAELVAQSKAWDYTLLKSDI